jgi:AcrR family transcriptional regulator
MTETPVDGRRQRSDASRRRIVEAMLDLAREGDPAPSADVVAERAGVGRRTVFRLFSDMESLYREMHATMLARIEHIRSTPIEGATWRERLTCLIDRRVTLFEEILPIKMAADVHRWHSAFLRKAHAGNAATLRQIMLFVLPAQIKNDEDAVEALDTALSIEVWERLRKDRGLSLKAARRVVDKLVAGLIEGVP